MPETSLSDQIKAAERDKLLAETRKAESEKHKIDFELEQAKKQGNVHRFLKTEFIKNLIIGIIGIGSLIFIINYMIIPFHDRDVLQAEIKNEETSQELLEKKHLLFQESLKVQEKDSMLTRAINSTITINYTVNKQKQIIDSLKAARQKVDIGYANVLKYYSSKVISNEKLIDAIKNLKKDMADYQAKKSELDSQPILKPFSPNTTNLSLPDYFKQNQSGISSLPYTLTNNNEKIGLSSLIETEKKTDPNFAQKVIYPTPSFLSGEYSGATLGTSLYPATMVYLEPKFKDEVVGNLHLTLSANNLLTIIANVFPEIIYSAENKSYSVTINKAFDVRLDDKTYKISGPGYIHLDPSILFFNKSIVIQLEKQ
jgi:hypothetical protein